jgi:hypothetical protein
MFLTEPFWKSNPQVRAIFEGLARKPGVMDAVIAFHCKNHPTRERRRDEVIPFPDYARFEKELTALMLRDNAQMAKG